MARWWRPARLWHRHETRDESASAGDSTDQTLPLRAHYLRRLDRLVVLHGRPALTEQERRFVNHALDATYRDCVSVGARQQARAMLGLPQQ
jgi:hypothetical protein